ncbi:rhodanese [Methylobacterium sp. BTF04]|uniref:rhodanese-like domain-containing protein n=1 Tax=Methylobacterium sp. BTF04 TaxID=2708300 RepID=UPI0013D8C3B3|nr:rhodanese-like domain-containing protein [Methylobacterium sp. BTF04]NEU12799.1 rhodanese [Methylobacterium sp. BTF04]
MRRSPLALPLVALAALVLGAAAPADSPVNVPEPAGYWEGALNGYTPKTLAGAGLVDAAGLAALIAAEKPVLLDVSEADRRPPDMAPGRIWLPVHRDIPGSVWLPGAGEGVLSPALEAALTARITALTGGDRDRPVVAYCHPDCWGSWNLGKRLVRLGYRRVSWFPEGIEGWQDGREDGRDTATIRADAEWSAARKASAGR